MAKIYYSRNSKIDESNLTRQDDLQLDMNLQTKYWSIKVNTSSLEWMMFIPTILVRLVVGWTTVTL